MKTARPWILIMGLALTAWLAYIARDAVQVFIVVPAAYGAWQLRALLLGVAQLLQWALLVVGMALIMFWQLIPSLGPRGRKVAMDSGRGGAVNSTAVALMRARSSNYFRWQLAHRLGRVARQLDAPGRHSEADGRPVAIAKYLDAGLNQSFVDHASPRLLFARPQAGVLSLNPADVVHHLESRLSAGGGRNVQGR
ncbi:MAG TPA: hypothetical protein VFH29_07260 [Anaerolineales bacterium]|nr:hypothetical protein [Anaerolineales bacterium]